MSSILVGMFDARSQAETARARLIEAGFNSAAITITSGMTAMDSGTDTAATDLTGDTVDTERSSTPAADAALHAAQPPGLMARFFEMLFGDDDAHDDHRVHTTNTYREAFSRGSVGVSVMVDDGAEHDNAEDILNDAGAIDIDERSQQWRSEGWSPSTSPSATSASMAGSASTTAASTMGAMGTSGMTGMTDIPRASDLASTSGMTGMTGTLGADGAPVTSSIPSASELAGATGMGGAGEVRTLPESDGLGTTDRPAPRGGVRVFPR